MQYRLCVKAGQLLTGSVQLWSLKEIGASEIGMEELLLHKRCHKTNFNCIYTIEKKYRKN